MKFLRTSLVLFAFLFISCANNTENVVKVGNYKIVQNVFYRFLREKFAFEIFLPNDNTKNQADYTIPLSNVYEFKEDYIIYDDNGNKIYNEFIIDKQYLIIYDR